MSKGLEICKVQIITLKIDMVMIGIYSAKNVIKKRDNGIKIYNHLNLLRSKSYKQHTCNHDDRPDYGLLSYFLYPLQK